MNDNNEDKKLPARGSLVMRLLVSLYLLYIVFSLRDVGSKYKDAELTFFLIAMVVFGVVGLILLVMSAYNLIRGKYIGGKLDDSPEEETEKDSEEN